MSRGLPTRTADLPASLLDVAETLGFRVALGLMQHFGGQEMKFPKHRPAPDHPIIRALGETDGYALCSFLGGAAIYVPRHRASGAMWRDVTALQAQGMERRAIARVLGISQRHVRRVANGLPRAGLKDGRQADLFDG